MDESMPSWSTSSAFRGNTMKNLEGLELMAFNQLDTLHQAFLDRWHGEDRGLTKKEFLSVLKNNLCLNADISDVDKIFTKVDDRETGIMRWSDFITSVCQTAQLKAYMAARAIKPLFRDKLTFINTKHRDEIVKICFIPRLSLQSTRISYNSGRYLMLGRDGLLTMWSINLSCIGSHFIGTTEGLKSLCFIDMTVLYPSTLIAVTSTDRKISFFELGSRAQNGVLALVQTMSPHHTFQELPIRKKQKKGEERWKGIQEKYNIVTLNNCATCLDFWSDLHSRTFSLLVWGDTGGDIHALEFNVNRLGGIFDKDSNREVISRVVYADLVKHKLPVAHLHKVSGVHDDWVTAVKYIPENKAFLSSSRSTNKQSLLYSDWFGKVDTRYYVSSKAVLCFDFSHIINLLVTGCLDCKIRVWNFFMSQRPVNTLKGHTSPLSHVALNVSTQHVISVDKNRSIKIFDYMMGTVIQSFSGPSSSYLGKRTQISAFFFNTVRCQLIVATSKLATATKRVNPAYMAEVNAHDYPISAICYSSAFQEILTACTNAVISVWDVHTGRHLLEFQHYSPRNKFREEPWAKDNVRMEISAMALDSSERCAVTGTNDGTVNLWNFSSGVLLSHYSLAEPTVVTGLAVDRNVIFAVGWSSRVYLMDREQKSTKDAPKYFTRVHSEEVNCMTLIKGGLLATGSYDGDIVVVFRDTGHPMSRLNAGQSQMPIAMRMQREDHEADDVMNRIADDDNVDETPPMEWSDEEYISTEDHSILRCIRISSQLVLMANPISGETVRIVQKPKVHKDESDDLHCNMVFDALRGKKVSTEESAATFRAFESSVEVLLCLHTRKHLDINTATVISAGAEGWIRAWSLNPKGGLKGQFLATELLGEAVKAMTTDNRNEFLITADTVGYIKIWDIFPYCNAAAKLLTERERQERRDRFSRMFIYLRSPFLRDMASEGFKRCIKNHKRHPPDESNPGVTLKTPQLLNVFRAHMQAITALQFDNEHTLIISGAKDCSVRVWTIKGAFVGHCGAPWAKLPSAKASVVPLRILPRDIRRNGSARSFRVMKSGCMPQWEHALHLIKNYMAEQRAEERKKARLEAIKAEARARGMSKGEGLMEEEEDESLLTPSLPLFHEPELPEDMRLTSILKFNWQDPKKSQILGRSFRPNLHHRLSPTRPSYITDDFGMIPAYRLVNISNISPMIRVPTPQAVKDMEVRLREEEEEAQRWRNARPKVKAKFKKSIEYCASDPPASTNADLASRESSISFVEPWRKGSSCAINPSTVTLPKSSTASSPASVTANNSALDSNNNVDDSRPFKDNAGGHCTMDEYDITMASPDNISDENDVRSDVMKGTDAERSFFLTSQSNCLLPYDIEDRSHTDHSDDCTAVSLLCHSNLFGPTTKTEFTRSCRWVSKSSDSAGHTVASVDLTRHRDRGVSRQEKLSAYPRGLLPHLPSTSATDSSLLVIHNQSSSRRNVKSRGTLRVSSHNLKTPKLPNLAPRVKTTQNPLKGTEIIPGRLRMTSLPRLFDK